MTTRTKFMVQIMSQLNLIGKCIHALRAQAEKARKAHERFNRL